MATFQLRALPGDVQSEMDNLGGGFNPGMLQGLMDWKMGMAQEMHRAKLAEMRMQMKLAQEAAKLSAEEQDARMDAYERSQRNQPQFAKPEKSMEERAREEYFKAAMTSTGSGTPGFDRYRRELMLKTLLGGGTGGGFSASPEAAAAAAANATGQGPGIMKGSEGFNQGMNTLERTQGSSRGFSAPSQYTPMDPGNRYTPGDVSIDTYYRGKGTSRKTGGHIPEDGWYYLHEDEDVVPSPATLRDLMTGRMDERRSNPGPGSKYQQGTTAARDELLEPDQSSDVMRLIQEYFTAPRTPEQLEELVRTNKAGATQGDLAEAFESEYAVPEPPAQPGAQDPEQMGRERTRQMVGDPDVHPQEVLDRLRAERERMARASGDAKRTSGRETGYLGIEGASVSESPLSERRQTSTFKGQPMYNRMEAPEGQTSVKSYTIDQTPQGPEEEEARRVEAEMQKLEQESQEIQRLNEAANSHAATASAYLEYASNNMGTPVYDAIREMAAGKLQLAQQMERAASQRQKQVDARQAAIAQSQARVAAAEIEARGRVGAADVGGRHDVNEALAKRQTEIMNNLRGLAQAFSGIEGGDPEAQEEMVRNMMQAFIMLGGMQDAFGGGLPNGG